MNVNIITNPKSKAYWNEYVSSGLMSDIGSFHRCLTIHALNKCGLASILNEEKYVSIESLKNKYDTTILTNFLNYLEVQNLVIIERGIIKLTEHGQRCLSPVSLAQIGFYIEAYSPVLIEMSSLLSGEKTYGTGVERNGKALGEHCATLFSIFHTEIILKIVAEYNITSILDLGCGGGAMLIDICESNNNLNGYGLDISFGAIDFANDLCAKRGLTQKLSFAVGDAFNDSTWPNYDKIDAISAVGTLHEHFRNGEAAVIEMLDFFAGLIESGRTKYFILGEPELYNDNHENDPDLYLVHVFTAQGFPRQLNNWLEVISKSKLNCDKVFTRFGNGPRFCFYVLTLK